jgi:hypothetical protein
MLANLINEHALADAQASKWDAVANALNDLRSEIIDQTHWSFGLMMSQGQLPQELVVGIAAAVKTAASVNPLMESAFIAFSTTGLQLHTTERQAMIEAIGAGLPAEAVAAVKALGVRSVPVVDTTADQCLEAWTASLKSAALERVTNTACEAAREEYRKADSTPESIIAAAVAVLEAG